MALIKTFLGLLVLFAAFESKAATFPNRWTTNVDGAQIDGATVTNTDIIGPRLSVVETLVGTRVGTTRGVNYKQNANPIPTNILYLASGEGIVRSIEYTSNTGDVEFDGRTNRSLRIYCDVGTINFGGALSLPATPTAEIPLSSIMDCKYWPSFRTNAPGPQTFSTRYVSWVEVPAAYARIAGAAHYTFTTRWPILFTNGVAIVIWDKSINSFTNAGYSFVNYELGTLPTGIRNYRLKTFHTITNGSQNPIVLNYTGAGEVASLFVSTFNDGLDGFTTFEGVWYQKPDGLVAQEAFGCAGGEDMFNNGFFFDGGANSTWDFGARYLHEDPSGTDNWFVETWRHFWGADSHRWQTNQLIYFNTPLPALEWDTLCVFYGK